MSERGPADPDRVEEILAKARCLPTGRLSDFLEQACGDDAALRAELDARLGALPTMADTRPAVAAPGGPVGERVGPYRLEEEIGAGGMGTVYRAVRPELGQLVALKLVREGRFASRESRERFLREQRLLARLQHPHCARLLDAGVTESGLPWFAMELVEGLPLLEHCDAHALPVEQRLALFEDLCKAVDYAHRNLIVHRDLKPANVMVTTDGIVKLLDFGIARLLDDEADDDWRTATGLSPLTPEHASPEQLRGEPVSVASDVYSLGTVLYQLLTGHRPHRFDRSNLIEAERVLSTTMPERPSRRVLASGGAEQSEESALQAARSRSSEPSRLSRRLAGDLDTIVLRALQPEPERRHGSAEQLRQDLARHRRHEPILARRDSFGYRSSKFIRRHRAAVAAALLVLGLLVGFGLRERSLRGAAELARDEARLEARKADRVTDFVVDLFEVADPLREDQAQPSIRDVLDRGARRVEAELATEVETQALMMSVIGRIQTNLGDYPTARQLLEGSLARKRSLLGEHDPAVARSLRELAELAYEEGDYAGAESSASAAVGLLTELGLAGSPQAADSLEQLARAQVRRRRHAAARDHQRRALEIRRDRADEDPARLAAARHALGRILIFAGEPEEAEGHFQAALAERQRLFGRAHPLVAETLDELGVIASSRGRLEEALELHDEALAARRASLGAVHPRVADSLAKSAGVLARLGRPEEAEVRAREAMRLRQDLLDPEHPDLASIRITLAGLLRHRDPGAAEMLVREALHIDRQAFGDLHHHVSSDLERLAQLVGRDPARLGEAEGLLRESLSIERRLGDDDLPLAFVLLALAENLHRQERCDEARPLLDESLRIFEAADAGPPAVATARRVLAACEAAAGASGAH